MNYKPLQIHKTELHVNNVVISTYVFKIRVIKVQSNQVRCAVKTASRGNYYNMEAGTATLQI